MGKNLLKRVMSTIMSLGIILSLNAVISVDKNAKKIEFAGRIWAVKNFMDFKVGPGPNLFSEDNIWVDKNGYLHLKIYKDTKTGMIYCAEIYSLDTFLYGTFEIELAELDYSKFPVNAVLGLFTYYGQGEEIDLEFTYMFWTDNFVNYSVQPLAPLYKFTPDLSKSTKHLITWQKECVEFKSICSSETYYKKFYNSHLLSKMDNTKLSRNVITSKPSRFHMNLWFHHKPQPPMQYIAKKYKNSREFEDFEVIIKDFKYYPATDNSLSDGIKIASNKIR